MKTPDFLRIAPDVEMRKARNQRHVEDYAPLLGIWLIDIAFALRLPQQTENLQQIFSDDDFIQVIGLPELEEVFAQGEAIDMDLPAFLRITDEDDKPMTTTRRRGKKAKGPTIGQQQKAVVRLLQKRREVLLHQGVDSQLPLFRNVERIGQMLHLNDTEKAIFCFTAVLRNFQRLRHALMMVPVELDDNDLHEALAQVTGYPEEAVKQALHKNAVLITSGLISIDHDEEGLQKKIDLLRELRGVLFEALMDDSELCRRILHLAAPGQLQLADFPHLQRDSELLCTYLRGVIREAARGANILLYGPPGTGKSEYAKALAAHLNLSLYEIAFADEYGDPIDGDQRLRSLNFSQRSLQGKADTLLLFDEIEDVLPGRPSGGFFNFQPKEPQGGKAWINRSLEDNPVPTIWITNDPDIDPAYLRRFDYALQLRIPPRPVRERITRDALGEFVPNAEHLTALAELDDLLPSQLERAARIARFTASEQPDQAWDNACQTLQRSRALLGQRRANLQPLSQPRYRLDYLNTDTDLAAILANLQRRPQQASFCLYGPPGTGKSQLARHIAEQLGKPFMLRRASELLGCYVGQTEKAIAAMFEQARDEDAVLVLDEADSFLQNRSGAQRSWEVTQVNEMLTQLESFDGLFFATTNLKDQLDPASLRRFSHKIRFDYLTPDQAWAMFQEESQRIGCQVDEVLTFEYAVRRLQRVTPGDFAVLVKQAALGNAVSAAGLLRQLEMELVAKPGNGRAIGF
jgi:transitional endoplasmic reticulum ATPase